LAKDGYVHYFNRRSTNFINKNNTPSAKSAFDHIKENENYSIAQCDKDFTNEIQKEDPLNKRIIDNNNFWFAYCELELKNESLFEYLKSKKEDLVSRISKTPDIDKKEEKKMNSKYKNEINRLDSKIKKAKSDIKNNNKYLCHQAEAATYFTLRGITFSRTHTVEFPEGWEIQNKSGFNIFLDNGTEKTLGKDNIRTCTPKDEFNWPGYW
jgi:membrane-anchored protein YejM (alkaline phosphatase superfamily)